jgi:hypothetical protein
MGFVDHENYFSLSLEKRTSRGQLVRECAIGIGRAAGRTPISVILPLARHLAPHCHHIFARLKPFGDPRVAGRSTWRGVKTIA